MKKRLTAWILALVLTLCGLVPAALAGDETPPEEAGYYYVYTENGKGLNVRETPGGKVVGSLRWGSRVYVDAFVDGTWALITFRYELPGYGVGNYAAYINRRFLTRKKPVKDEDGQNAKAAEEAPADPLEAINKEFKESKKVSSYRVTVRPARVSGWVNMHWAPSNDSELLATYKANDTLLVIRELPNWLQVEDQDTGDVGFINRQFVAE